MAAYLSTRKYKEALCTAKEAVATLPNNAYAVALVGRVLATSPEGTDKARRAFQKALALDAACADAALALSDLHLARGDHAEAAACLKRSLGALERDALHAKLADVHVQADEIPAALAAYHAALSLNPTCEAALAGLDNVEKMMRGGGGDDLDDESVGHSGAANSAELDEALDGSAFL